MFSWTGPSTGGLAPEHYSICMPRDRDATAGLLRLADDVAQEGLLDLARGHWHGGPARLALDTHERGPPHSDSSSELEALLVINGLSTDVQSAQFVEEHQRPELSAGARSRRPLRAAAGGRPRGRGHRRAVADPVLTNGAPTPQRDIVRLRLGRATASRPSAPARLSARSDRPPALVRARVPASECAQQHR